MTGLYVVLFLSAVACVLGQDSSFNCNQLPPFTPDVKNCCKRPTVKLDKYKAACYNSTVTGRFGMRSDDNHAFMNPCAVECIYTEAGALNNGVFNMPNMQRLLGEILPNDPELAKVFFAGFQKCGPETRQKMQEFEANRPLNAQGQPVQYLGQRICSPFAVLTTFCAMRYTFMNCPASLWTTSELCTKAQNYVRNCEPMQFGGPRNRNRSRAKPAATST